MSMGTRFLSYIKSIRALDVFNRPVKLLLNKEESHKTIFGAFLTILLMGVVSSTLLYNLVELIKKEQPNSFQSEIEIDSPPAHKLVASNFTVQLGFVNSTGSAYIDETIYKLHAYLVERDVTVEDGNSKETKKKINLPMIRCNMTKNYQPSLELYFQGFDQSNSYCIDWSQISEFELQGSYDAQKYQFIKFEFRICENESLAVGDQPCQSEMAMKQQLTSNNFQMQFTSINFELSNYAQPHIPSGQDVFTTISSNVFKKMEIYMQPVETQTDEGILTTNFKKQTALKYLNYIEMTDFDQTNQLMNVTIRLSKVELVNHRNYKKLQALLGEAGGLWQILFTAILLIQDPLSRLSYQLKLLNALFNFEGKETSNLDTLHRISSVRQINLQLNSPMVNSIGIKQKLLTNVRNMILNFFKTISYKMKLKPLEFITCYRNRYNIIKSQQIEYSKKKLEKCLDILYIINKLQEIDKLKMILLTVPQIKLFDFLPKPTIYCDQFSDSQKNQQQYFSVLSPQISYYQKSVEAKNAFTILLQHPNEEINKKLIQMMHPSIIELLNELNNSEILNVKHDHSLEQDVAPEELF